MGRTSKEYQAFDSLMGKLLTHVGNHPHAGQHSQRGSEARIRTRPSERRLMKRMGEPDETPQDWQDISTAPKDGTWILSFGKLWTLPTLAQWNTARNCWQDMDHALWQVTHWMTLPVPPPGVKEGTHDEENKGAEDRAEDRDHSRNARQTGSVEGRQSSPESVVGEGVGASPHQKLAEFDAVELDELKSIRNELWNKTRSPEGEEEQLRYVLANRVDTLVRVTSRRLAAIRHAKDDAEDAALAAVRDGIVSTQKDEK